MDAVVRARVRVRQRRSRGACEEQRRSVETEVVLSPVDLDFIEVCDEGARFIAEDLCAPQATEHLVSVDAQYNCISPVGAAALAMALGSNCPLRTLLLGHNQLYAEGAAALADGLLVNTQLRVLSLAGNLLGDAGAAAVARGLELNHGLRAIDLQHNAIGAAGAEALGRALTYNQTLRALLLSWNKLGGKGASALADGVRSNRALQVLALHECALGDDGLLVLATALAHSGVRSLLVGGNQLGRSADVFAQAVAKLLVASSRLEVLGLDYNELGEEHVLCVAAGLPTCRTLRHVLLHGNAGQRSPAGVALAGALRTRK